MKVKQRVISDFSTVLSGRAKIFCDLAVTTKKDFSEEAIHDFRVSTRRLLIAETLLGTDSKTGQWKKNSRRLLKQLSCLRDLQVLQIRFYEEILLAEQLAEDIEREIKQLQNLNRDISIKDLSKKIARSIKRNKNELKSHPRRLAGSICGIWKDMRAEIDGLIIDADYEDYRLLHRIRIRFKSFRYLTEILLDANIIKNIEISNFKLWQDFLGNIQDLTVAIKWLEGRDGTSTIQQQLMLEMDRQRIAFWDEKDHLVGLLDQLDRSIAESVLSCSYQSEIS